MTCHQLACVLDSEHKGDCNYSKVGPYKCRNGHWIHFATPTARIAACPQCDAFIHRGDPQP